MKHFYLFAEIGAQAPRAEAGNLRLAPRKGFSLLVEAGYDTAATRFNAHCTRSKFAAD